MASNTLIRLLLKHSVKTGDFILKSGRRRSWFVDVKQTACLPEGILAISEAALSTIENDIDAIGGLTMGADPVAFGVAAIAATRGRHLKSFSIRKESKDHGVTGRVAGCLSEGDRVVIIEDATTRGVSMLDAAAVVREFGADPVMLLAVVDGGGTAAGLAAREGIEFRALVTAVDLGLQYEGG